MGGFITTAILVALGFIFFKWLVIAAVFVFKFLVGLIAVAVGGNSPLLDDNDNGDDEPGEDESLIHYRRTGRGQKNETVTLAAGNADDNTPRGGVREVGK